MMVLLLVAFLVVAAALATAIVITLYVHKRNRAGDIKLIGEMLESIPHLILKEP